MQKPKLTKRKFYNKWLYKVTLFCPGVSLYRLLSYDDTISFLINPSAYAKTVFSSHNKALKNKDTFLELTRLLSDLNQQDFAKRIEVNTIDLYVNSKSLFDNISTKFESITVNRFAPTENNLELLENTNFILTKNLPHKKYKYKVYLLPHKLKGDKNSKTRYLNWLDTQGDKILISSSVKTWFLTTDWYWDRRYLYVEDANTLLMLKMRDSQVLGKIYEYLIVDKY
jgi:hypothetical protein